MHCVGGHTLASVLFVAGLITLFFLKTFFIINNVGRTLLLTLPRKQNGRPIGYITLLSIIAPVICRVRRLWRLIYGLRTMAMLVGPLMDVKDPGKVRNRRVAKSRIVFLPIILILILVKKFIPRKLIHGCRYCSINNTNELRLLVSSAFWVKKGIDGRTNQFEKQQYTGSN